MTEEIKGTVTENPVLLENCCMFLIEQSDAFYLVLSTDVQATKDGIFVTKGQEMIIKGCLMDDVRFKGILVTEQAKINLKKF